MRIDEDGVVVLSLTNLQDLWAGRTITHLFTQDEDTEALIDHVVGDDFISVRLEEEDIP